MSAFWKCWCSCSRRLGLPRPWDLLLGSGETVDQLLTLSCKRQGRPPPFLKAQQWDLEQHPQLLWAFFYHCPNGAPQNLPSPLQTAESQQDRQRPVTEVFWARICGRDENADELTDPWVSSGVSAPHYRDRVDGRVGSFLPVQTSVQDGLSLA